MNLLDHKRCIAMEQVTEDKWEDIVRHASEVGLFGHSVKLVAFRKRLGNRYGSL